MILGNMIHDDLFGQDKENEEKLSLSYDKLPDKARTTVAYIIIENAYHFENELFLIKDIG
jgi:hypothetical protein